MSSKCKETFLVWSSYVYIIFSYKFRVALVSNRVLNSSSFIVTTNEESMKFSSKILKWLFISFAAPKEPTESDIQRKIVFDADHSHSTATQSVIKFDPTLFSDDHGYINNYSFYVRQGTKQYT